MPSAAEILRDYLLNKYKNVKIIGPEKKAWLRIKSDIISESESVVYVNDSVIHPNNKGWLDLSQDDYNKLVSSPGHYYAIMLEKNPERVFVVPGNKLATYFGHVEPNFKQGKRQWDFSIIERDGSHNTLVVNRAPSKEHPLGDLLNKWDQVDEFNNQLAKPVIRVQEKLSFSKLHDYIVEKMDMQANYQPIMIRVLLESGGRAQRAYIAEQIRELNSEEPKSGFINIPVYETLEKNGIVTRCGDEFVLNVGDLSPEEKQELILLCEWKTYTQPLPFEEMIRAFDKNRKLFKLTRPPLKEILKKRNEFITEFSGEKIPSLQLDEYVQGKPDPKTGEPNHSTFCFRLERDVPWFGNIWGTPADKFGIYYSKQKRDYAYKNHDKFESAEEAFEQIEKSA